MRTAFKRTLTVIIIAALSVCCGILYDRLCDRNERAEYPREYTSSVMKYSAEFGVPANIIYAALKVESNFNSALKTGEGENSRVGLMQLSADDYRTYGSRTLIPVSCMSLRPILPSEAIGYPNIMKNIPIGDAFFPPCIPERIQLTAGLQHLSLPTHMES